MRDSMARSEHPRFGTVRSLPACLLLALGVGCASEVDVEKLYVQSNSEDYEERVEARAKLNELVQEGRVEPFAKGLRSGNAETRVRSILHLMSIKTPDAKAALVGELELSRRFNVFYNPIRLVPVSTPSDSRIMIAHILLLNGGDPRAVEVLSGTYGKEPDVEARVGTMYALGALYDAKTIPTLRQGLRDPDLKVVTAAVEALTQLEVPDVAGTLIQGLSDPDETIRANSASTLAGFPGKPTAEALAAALRKESSLKVRLAVLASLGDAGGPEAIPDILSLLQAKEGDPAMRERAALALQSLTGQDFGQDAARWERWWSANRSKMSRP